MNTLGFKWVLSYHIMLQLYYTIICNSSKSHQKQKYGKKATALSEQRCLRTEVNGLHVSWGRIKVGLILSGNQIGPNQQFHFQQRKPSSGPLVQVSRGPHRNGLISAVTWCLKNFTLSHDANFMRSCQQQSKLGVFMVRVPELKEVLVRVIKILGR